MAEPVLTETPKEVPKATSMLQISKLDYYVNGLQTSRMTLNTRNRSTAHSQPMRLPSKF